MSAYREPAVPEPDPVEPVPEATWRVRVSPSSMRGDWLVERRGMFGWWWRRAIKYSERDAIEFAKAAARWEKTNGASDVVWTDVEGKR